MEKNIVTIMDELEIEEGIRDLIKNLWGHNYNTTNSCEGTDISQAYIMCTGGDGWFKDNASLYGLKEQENESCCEYEKGNCCDNCGAGINGNSIYRGELTNNQNKTKQHNFQW